MYSSETTIWIMKWLLTIGTIYIGLSLLVILFLLVVAVLEKKSDGLLPPKKKKGDMR